MHYARIIFAAVAAALGAGLVGGTLWSLVFGSRLLYRLYRWHPQLWKEFNFRLSVFGPYSPAFSAWLRRRQYEQLQDPVTTRVATRLVDARPILVLMGLAATLVAIVLSLP